MRHPFHAELIIRLHLQFQVVFDSDYSLMMLACISNLTSLKVRGD